MSQPRLSAATFHHPWFAFVAILVASQCVASDPQPEREAYFRPTDTLHIGTPEGLAEWTYSSAWPSTPALTNPIAATFSLNAESLYVLDCASHGARLYQLQQDGPPVDLTPSLGSTPLDRASCDESTLHLSRGDSVAVFQPSRGLILVVPSGGGRPRGIAVPTLASSPGSLNPAVLLRIENDGEVLAVTSDRMPQGGTNGPRWTTSDVLRLDPETGRGMRLGVVPREQIFWSSGAFVRLLFAPVVQLSAADGISVLGRGDEPLISTNVGRRRTSAIAWTEPPDRVDRTDVMEWVRWRATNLDDTLRLPGLGIRPVATIPSYSRVLSSVDGRVWVERYRWYTPHACGPRAADTEWIIFSPSNGRHGTIRVPRNEIVLAVAGDLFAVSEELDDMRLVAVHEVRQRSQSHQ